MALKATKLEAELNEWVQAMIQADKHMAQGMQSIDVGKSTLDGMDAAAKKALPDSLTAKINAAASADPANSYLQQLKAKMDLFVAELAELRVYAIALKAAGTKVARPSCHYPPQGGPARGSPPGAL